MSGSTRLKFARSQKAICICIIFAGIGLNVSCGSKSGASQSGSQRDDGGQTKPSGMQNVDVVKVISQRPSLTVRLPGELQPYEVVDIYPKVTGFVDSISVDRGSVVKAGRLMVKLVAPEIAAQRAEAQSKLQAADAQRIESEAKLASDEGTYQRLKTASATPGVVAGNDLEVAQKAADADRARVQAAREAADAAKAAFKSITEVEGYLQIRAPFDGTVTQRNVHPGALVGPGGNVPMLRVEKVSRLRLVLPVPENYVGGTVRGARVEFSVPAFPGEKFTGTIARVADSLDVKTRTMPVELDVINKSGRLASGMYPEANWPVQRARPTLFVPPSAVARTNESTFVVRIRDGTTEWVKVQTGEINGKLVEVFGDLREGDQVALRGTDELRPGTHVTAKLSSTEPTSQAR
jgi:membrane fusion protein, multidrug efflux system